MPVHLARETPALHGVRPKDLVRSAERMMRSLQIKNAELSILITGDDQIKILNRDYRKKNRPTDVLAFAMREGEAGALAGDVLGDVVISLETAARQAAEQGRSTQDEVTFLLAHGLLHLLGWDHDTDETDRAMRRETERLCRAAKGSSASGEPAAAASRPKTMPIKKRSSRGAKAAAPPSRGRRKSV